MIQKDVIEYIKENKKFPKTVRDYLPYYYFIFSGAFLFIGILSAYSYIEIERKAAPLIFSIIFICAGIFSSFVIYRRSKENITFETITPNYDIDIDTIADRVSKNFKLTEIKVNSQLCSINAIMRYRILSEITLTIVLHGKEILVNSRPDRVFTAITPFQDRLNIQKLRRILSE